MAKPAPNSLPVAALLTGLVAFGAVSTDVYLPSLPAISRDLDADVSLVQVTLSVFVAGFAVCQLFYGPLADRFGRRPVILAGVATYIAASIFCVFAPSIEMLILGRFLQALGGCVGPVLGRAVVRDVYPKEQAARVLSYMASAMALMPAVAPILGGWVFTLFGWRANFVVLALFGTILLLGTVFLLAETNKHRDPYALRPRRILATYAHLLANRQFVADSLCLAFSFSALFSFISGSSFVLIDTLGLAPEYFGLAFACVVLGYMSGTFVSGRLGHRFGPDRMVRAGVLLGVAGGGVLAGLAWAGIATITAVVAPMILVFASCGLVLPNATAAAIAPFARMAGSASAMLGFIQMAGGALAGYLVGRLHDGTTVPMAEVVLATTVLALLSHLFRPRQPAGLP